MAFLRESLNENYLIVKAENIFVEADRNNWKSCILMHFLKENYL